jgi:hypothetical protein
MRPIVGSWKGGPMSIQRLQESVQYLGFLGMIHRACHISPHISPQPCVAQQSEGAIVWVPAVGPLGSLSCRCRSVEVACYLCSHKCCIYMRTRCKNGRPENHFRIGLGVIQMSQCFGSLVVLCWLLLTDPTAPSQRSSWNHWPCAGSTAGERRAGASPTELLRRHFKPRFLQPGCSAGSTDKGVCALLVRSLFCWRQCLC